MNEISFRKAERSDYEQVIALYSEFVGDDRYKGVGGDSFKDYIKREGNFLDLAVVDGRIVGFISYSQRTVVRYGKDICEVEELYVREEFRHHGLGGRLMERVLEHAKKQGCQYIFVSSAKKWTDAHKFYEDLGFEEYGFHYRRKP